jgi:hypothetical protein
VLKVWVHVLNAVSAVEFAIADRAGEAVAALFHFGVFWGLPIALLAVPHPAAAGVAIACAAFYVWLLAGDVFLSVFGHEDLEHRRGMIDIASVREMRAEIAGAFVKYLGGIVSFATIYTGVQNVTGGAAFSVPHPSPWAYVDFLYFSGVAITTVGFGDIVPTLAASRMVVLVEVLFGLGFALLLVGMLIAVYIDIQRRRE